jgi:hypothetical protein
VYTVTVTLPYFHCVHSYSHTATLSLCTVTASLPHCHSVHTRSHTAALSRCTHSHSHSVTLSRCTHSQSHCRTVTVYTQSQSLCHGAHTHCHIVTVYTVKVTFCLRQRSIRWPDEITVLSKTSTTRCRAAMRNQHQPDLPQVLSPIEVFSSQQPYSMSTTLPEHAQAIVRTTLYLEGLC